MMTTAIDRRRIVQGAGAAGALSALGLVGADRATAAAGAAPASPRVPLTAATPVLRVGSKGSAVKDLQTKLSQAGYWLGSVDGGFGSLTQQAVYALQKYHGLSRDGIVGPATWAKVNLRQRPRSRYASVGNLIEIEKKRQLIFAVRNGRVEMCLNTSTGADKPFEAWGRWYNGQTPSGKFKVFRYKPGWYTNDLGGLYRPMFFNGGIAVHGSNSIPPYKASHGCCRVSVAAQDRLIATKMLWMGATVYCYWS